MTWLETWAMWQVIGACVGLGILALCLLVFAIVVIKICIEHTYKNILKSMYGIV